MCGPAGRVAGLVGLGQPSDWLPGLAVTAPQLGSGTVRNLPESSEDRIHHMISSI